MYKFRFSKERFRIFHPGGAIGQKLSLVKDIMIKGNRLPLINYKNNAVKAIQTISNKNLGLGIIVSDLCAKIFLVCCFSNSDLRWIILAWQRTCL